MNAATWLGQRLPRWQRSFFFTYLMIKLERKFTMSQLLIAFSTLAACPRNLILIGHYLLLSLIYLPGLAKGNGTIAQ